MQRFSGGKPANIGSIANAILYILLAVEPVFEFD